MPTIDWTDCSEWATDLDTLTHNRLISAMPKRDTCKKGNKANLFMRAKFNRHRADIFQDCKDQDWKMKYMKAQKNEHKSLILHTNLQKHNASFDYQSPNSDTGTFTH